MTASDSRRKGGRPTFSDPQVNLYMTDVDAAVSFYREMFGFQETFRTPGVGRAVHVEMRLGRFILGVASIESLRGVHGVAGGTGPPRGEIVLWTDHVDDAYNLLCQQGVRSLSPPHNFNEALRAAWVADPDGNPIQIVERRVR